jgi:hypothetical protein
VAAFEGKLHLVIEPQPSIAGAVRTVRMHGLRWLNTMASGNDNMALDLKQ